MTPINLRPFGFTPTESLAYAALLERGFTSAYALGKTIGVARANVYQALNGLVSKGAAVKVSDQPQVFRPVGPTELLAMITRNHTAVLDQLEAEIASLGAGGEPISVPFASQREFGELALRVAARAASVSCIASTPVLEALTPIWRKRLADGTDTELWVLGDEQPGLPVPLTGRIERDRISLYFHGDPVLLIAGDSVIAGRQEAGNDLKGVWSSDPLQVGLVSAAVESLTGA